jgi:hypothetical protein
MGFGVGINGRTGIAARLDLILIPFDNLGEIDSGAPPPDPPKTEMLESLVLEIGSNSILIS